MSEVISYKLTGDWRHIIDDGLVDLDALPDEALPTGHVEFIPVSPQVAVSGSPDTAYTVSSFKSLIAAGVLTDLQGREGVQIAGKIGEHPILWRAVTHLEYRGQKIDYPTIEFTLEADARLTGILASHIPGGPATIYHPRIEALIAEVDGKSDIGHLHQITDVEGLQQALEDAAYSGGGGEGGPVSWTQVRNKPTTFPPSEHSHAWSQITDRPEDFPPEGHVHQISDVDGLQAALDAAAASGGGGTTLTPGSVETEHLADRAVTSDKIADNAITNAQLGDSVVRANNLLTWAVTRVKLHRDVQDELDGLRTDIDSKSDTGHGHSITDISGLQQALEDAANSGTGGGGGDGSPVTWTSVTGKPTVFPPEAHTHLIGDVGGLQGALDAKVGDTDPRLTDARTPTAHTHIIGDTTGLQDALDAKVGTEDPRLSDARTPTAHTHAITEITDLQTSLNSKVDGSDPRLTDARTPTEHEHVIEDVAGLQAALDDAASSGESGPVSWTDVIDKPTEFNPSAHGHEIAEINGLQAALDAASGGEGDSGTALYIVGAPYNAYWEVPDPVEGDIFLSGDGTVHRHSDLGLWLDVGAIKPANISGWQIADLAVTKGKLAQALQDEITGHSHEIADVNGLQGELDGKVDDTDPRLTDPRTPTEHTHAWSEVTDKPTIFPASWISVIGKPSNFPPSTHEHAISEINGLQDALDAKIEGTGDITAESLGAVERAGRAVTLWSGTQAEYDALPESTRHAVGFVGVII